MNGPRGSVCIAKVRVILIWHDRLLPFRLVSAGWTENLQVTGPVPLHVTAISSRYWYSSEDPSSLHQFHPLQISVHFHENYIYKG